jgi:hypothetical protein
MNEHRAVLCRRDVPLQALKDQHVLVGLTGSDNVRVDFLHANPHVGGAAVVGNDQPVHPVRTALADLVDDPVDRIRAVLGVDVVVTGEPEVSVLAGLPGRSSGGRRRAAEDAGRRDTGAKQTCAAQHLPARQGRWRNFRVGDAQVGDLGSDLIGLRVLVNVRMVTVSHARLRSIEGVARGCARGHARSS